MSFTGARRWAVWALALALIGCAGERTEKPDIFLIVVDTLRADHVGYASGGSVSTPNIDALAAGGHRFSNAFAHTPITGPSHAAIFTGRRPSEAGVLNNVEQPLPEGLETLPNVLTAAGYQCYAAVSIAPIRGRLGFASGFIEYEDELGPAFIRATPLTLGHFREYLHAAADSTAPQFHMIHMADPHEPYDALGTVQHSAQYYWNGELRKTIDTATFSPTLEPIELKKGTNEVRLVGDYPFRVRRIALLRTRHATAKLLKDHHDTKEYESEYTFMIEADADGTAELALVLDDLDGSREEIQRRYRLEAENVDRFVGEILAEIRASGRYDEALIIFTSDHGEAIGHFGDVGHVHQLYDRYVHIPLAIKPPASWDWEPGLVREDLAVHADYLPTLCELLGIPGPPGMTGRQLYQGADSAVTPDGEMIVLETHTPQARATKYAVRSSDRKLIFTPETEQWEFFDLGTDPNEQTNLFEERREEAEPYVKRLLSERDLMNERAAALGGAPVEVDEDAEEVLRALGYVN